MSENNSVGCGCSSGFGLWLLVFLILKVGGTVLAHWSWFWVLLPVVPVVVVALQKAGLL